MYRPLRTLAILPALLLPGAALAWTPALDEATAQQVIDTAYKRPVQNPKPTYQTVDLRVEGGTFKVPGSVKQVLGPETCLSSWQADPSSAAAGSRMLSVTASGQADSVYWQATRAYKDWLTLRAADVLTEQARATRMADGLLRIDIKVTGARSEAERSAYRARLKAGDTFLDPVRSSYVADWKQGEDGLWTGTVVYYFSAAAPRQAPAPASAPQGGATQSVETQSVETQSAAAQNPASEGTATQNPAEAEAAPTAAAPAAATPALLFDPNGPVEVQFLNEKGECGYSVPLNLGSFL